MFLPLRAVALEETPLVEVAGAPVIITEIQTGGATASEEFIELFNTSDNPVDITGWEIRIAAAGAANDATSLLATVGTGQQQVVLPAKAYFVLHTSVVTLPEGILGQQYSAALTKNDKTIALFARDAATCQMTVQDAVAWESVPGTTWGEGEAITVSGVALNADKLLERYMVEGAYVDTDNNAHDFRLIQGTPGQDNPAVPTEHGEGTVSDLASFPAANCEPPAEEPPVEPPVEEPNEGLLTPLITELMPNPGPPLTDAADEYIELYNPNSESFDLSGYTLVAGTTTTYQFVFPSGTMLEPQSYTTFYSSETNIALSNSGGLVRLKDVVGIVTNETATYTAAGNDQAWVLIDETWQWTTISTPNELNLPTPEEPPVEEPPAEEPPQENPGIPNQGLTPPQVTELLPNPGAPKTDQQDEFIELYNPNDAAFDLSNYVLEAGLTSKYRYTFPAGTTLQPQSYMAFFSADTGVTLSNSSGQVRLIDPAGTVVVESSEYGTAKDDQAWTFIGGSWQWTTTPTPNAVNVLTAPAPKTKATSSTTKSKKAAPSKSSTSKTKDTKGEKDEEGAFAGTTGPTTPLHPGVLALIAGFAVLYGAYEYRHDVANKIRQFRTNRATRRSLGQGAQGR